MAKQKTDWGEIQWIDDVTIRGLKTGIVSLLPGGHQHKHIHYEEQVIYVIQGHARSIIDGEETILKAGSCFHWNAGVEHEVINIGNIPFQHLLISNPEMESQEELFPKPQKQTRVDTNLIYTAVEAIRNQFLETLHYSYSIFDSMGNQILQSPVFPEYCMDCCHPEEKQGICPCMSQLKPEVWGEETVFQCALGMEIFHYPIYFEGVLLGYIQGGYIRHSATGKGKIEKVYDVPESVVAGIKVLLWRITKAIRNYCEFEQFRRALVEKELCIASHEQAQKILMKNLKDTQYAMTDLKINNHFLFNTLNSMASMALDGGMMPLYQSIVDLSKMFHYTLRAQSSIVSLDKEMEYIQAYLHLQKMRYGENLEISCHIDPKVKQMQVPFNFLQPIIENAFVHGFDAVTLKKITIEIRKTKQLAEIHVKNSGKKLTLEECRKINQSITSGAAHGLAMVYQKLVAIYEQPCKFEIGKAENGDTCFTVCLPCSYQYFSERRDLVL